MKKGDEGMGVVPGRYLTGTWMVPEWYLTLFNSRDVRVLFPFTYCWMSQCQFFSFYRLIEKLAQEANKLNTDINEHNNIINIIKLIDKIFFSKV